MRLTKFLLSLLFFAALIVCMRPVGAIVFLNFARTSDTQIRVTGYGIIDYVPSHSDQILYIDNPFVNIIGVDVASSVFTNHGTLTLGGNDFSYANIIGNGIFLGSSGQSYNRGDTFSSGYLDLEIFLRLAHPHFWRVALQAMYTTGMILMRL